MGSLLRLSQQSTEAASLGAGRSFLMPDVRIACQLSPVLPPSCCSRSTHPAGTSRRSLPRAPPRVRPDVALALDPSAGFDQEREPASSLFSSVGVERLFQGVARSAGALLFAKRTLRAPFVATQRNYTFTSSRRCVCLCRSRRTCCRWPREPSSRGRRVLGRQGALSRRNTSQVRPGPIAAPCGPRSSSRG